MIQSPCKDCPNRHLKCHSECQKYQDYRKNLEAEKSLIKLEKEIDTYQKIACKKSKDISLKKKHWRKSNGET